MLERGCIVRSTPGHDKGDLLLVLGMEDGLALVCDGKRRRKAKPKRKKPSHVDMVCGNSFPHPDLDRLRRDGVLSDKGIRRALAAFRDTEQGGNETWQRAT